MKSFSDRCKELLIGAEKLARVSNNIYIYPEHLALTIFLNPSYLIKKILDEVNLDVKTIISDIKKNLSKKNIQVLMLLLGMLPLELELRT